MTEQDTRHNCGQVALQVGSQREEVRNDEDADDAAFGQTHNSAFEVWLAEFEECRLYMRERTGARQFSGYRADRLVGGLDARAMGEDDDPRAHALP
jgi:hypothetical protein